MPRVTLFHKFKGISVPSLCLIEIRLRSFCQVQSVTQFQSCQDRKPMWVSKVSNSKVMFLVYIEMLKYHKQGKSEGFESCDRPVVRKRPIWVKIYDVLSHVTLKFDG